MLRDSTLVLILIATTGPAWADSATARFTSERARASKALLELRHASGGGELAVDWPVHRTRPAAIRGLSVATAGGSDEARARGFLSRHPALVELGRSGNTLRLLEARRAHGLRALRFQLEHRGLEVLGATIVVALDDQARVTSLSSEVEPIALASITPKLDAEGALAAVRAQLGVLGRGGVARLAIVAEGAARLVYRVRLPYPIDPQLARFHLVDAGSGRYLGWRPTGIVESLGGKGVGR